MKSCAISCGSALLHSSLNIGVYTQVSRARHAVHFHHKAISDTRCLYTLAFNSIKVYNKQPCITSPHSGKKITKLRRAVFRRWCAYLNQLC